MSTPSPAGASQSAQHAIVVRSACPGDLPAILALLAAAHLPGAGVAEWLARFFVAEADGKVVGVAGLEVHGADGLLRSVAVAGDWRGRGLGSRLTAEVLAAAEHERLRGVYLLTDTAENYFPRHGFAVVARAEVPETIRGTTEYRELCPSSSIVMVKPLSPGA